mmetsp:Transcript_4522/g.28737  ORF Transcript_4522/g.28737 Transcript_4522/m.28737 type:complete len:89 (-) Transcript_4522:1305-1571(-)
MRLGRWPWNCMLHGGMQSGASSLAPTKCVAQMVQHGSTGAKPQQKQNDGPNKIKVIVANDSGWKTLRTSSTCKAHGLARGYTKSTFSS